MHFLADVYVPCEVCKGKRYNRETLEVKYKDKNIYDVLNMTVEEALGFFENVPSIRRKIQTLYDVGLSYIRLGQPSTELSGGEAQRISIARALIQNPNIIIFDDSTSAVDSLTEKRIRQAMKTSHSGCTKFIIAQRISSVRDADKILVLGGGKIVAEGNHKYLMETSTEYQEILASQMKKGVMADGE